MTDEQHFKRFFALYPKGNPKFCKNKYDELLGTKTFFDEEITHQLLYNRYNAYIIIKKPLQNGTYTKKENAIKTPFEWLSASMYQAEEKSMDDEVTKNDRYLYGIE